MGEGKWDMGGRSGPELLTMVGLCGFLERWRKGRHSLPHRVVFGGEEELESITANQGCPAKAQLPWCHQLIPYHWLLPQHRSSEVFVGLSSGLCAPTPSTGAHMRPFVLSRTICWHKMAPGVCKSPWESQFCNPSWQAGIKAYVLPRQH